ncbi:MAG: type II toxin-antitoxin system RelE/ParE family toxin [Leadbetterella sp.]|nr:type II toxin-antitoxin system RelE/ParE family toxin [Leadbetterella sp.]
MHNYYISKKALEDLENIWEYTDKQWSRQQANLYLEIIFAAIELISEDPLKNKEYTKLKRKYRASRVKSHVIFYLLTDTRIIEIIRILHKSMDLNDKFE